MEKSLLSLQNGFIQLDYDDFILIKTLLELLVDLNLILFSFILN